MNKILLTLLILIQGFILNAVTPEVTDSLRSSLERANTQADSISILYNIFDTSDRNSRPAIAEELYQLAFKANDVNTQLDMLRQLSNFSSASDSLYDVYLQRVKALPYSNEKKATSIFITVRSSTKATRRATIEQSQERIHELIKRAELNKGNNIQTSLELLFTICAYMEQVPNGQLFSEYVEQLGDMIENSPVRGYPLNSLYYTQAAITYTSIGQHDKAIAADRELLKIIDDLEDSYRKQGRVYKDFSYNRYVIYRRMLSNFKALSPEDIEETYSRLKELAAGDSTFKNDFEVKRIPDMYYAIARNDFKTALPLLKNVAYSNTDRKRPFQQLEMIDYIIEAADSLGDRQSLAEAALKGHKIRNSDELKRTIDVFKELQSIMEVNKDRLERATIELEKRNAQLKIYHVTRICAASLIITLLILIFFLVRTWRRTKTLNKNLAVTNDRLKEERDTLKRTQAEILRIGERARLADRQREEFIANLSHEVSTPLNAINEYCQLIVDCGDAEKKPYLNRFSEVIKLNISLLQTLVNDVLDLATIDRGIMKVEKSRVVIGRVAAIATDSVKPRVQPGVQLINTIDPDYNQIIFTDSKRVLQVLLNLLVNAAKFTPEGKITLAGELIEDRRVYKFTVTDTGIGIPTGKEDIIFERFEKLNRHSQGLGLGLPVSRLIATLLGGDVVVETNYRGPGARFAFYVPID
ncbi:MAG: HAMP domain-containing histidine kinase [Muribaculaceae bacterium]|nr:HAMP domain-containing histidine kinase [Muribaculaceae bacterium]